MGATLKKVLMEGFQNEISIQQLAATVGMAILLGLYIFAIYRFHNRNSFYVKDFNITLPLLTLITAGIVLALQFSLVVSLGMVGALSIVRFRNAVKETMDLMFLFWAVGVGIICGAELFGLAVIICLAVTALLTLLQLIPLSQGATLIVIRGDANQLAAVEGKLREAVKKICVKSRTVDDQGFDLVAEIKLKRELDLIESMRTQPGVESVSLLDHNGAIR